jgi:serine-protein kinase ATM
LPPVFRYFFYEHFHRKKQAYATSVATSSIIGYLVGLGDRHVQNILIDTQTAEVIHIDLGVAFDQGKMCVDTQFRTNSSRARSLVSGCPFLRKFHFD